MRRARKGMSVRAATNPQDDYELVHTREEDAGHSPKSRYAACIQSQRNKRGGLAWHDILNRPALKPSEHRACLGALRNSAFKTTVRLHGPLPACPIRRPNREHSPVLSRKFQCFYLAPESRSRIPWGFRPCRCIWTYKFYIYKFLLRYNSFEPKT